MSERRNGRHLVRVHFGGKRHRIGSCTTQEEADQLRAEVYARADSAAGVTLRAWGAQWFERRERFDNVRSIDTERSRWKTHVEGSRLADMALVMITPADVDAWICELQKKLTATPYREPKPLSPKTIKEVINLLRMCLDEAMPAHITVNPVAAVKKRVQKATKRRHTDATVEPWTYLEPDEQARIHESASIPEADKLIILFALLTGLREGEQFNQELRDLHLDAPDPYLEVRYGAKNEPPKNGKIRRVYLSPDAVAVIRRWLEILPSWAPQNPEGLIFPGPRGGRIAPGKTPLIRHQSNENGGAKRVNGKRQKVNLFPVYMRACGITRPVRWHDLRHSCASSLVAGWWGRRWTLEEVREHLGHTSIQATQRYAHIGETAYKAAIRSTPGWARETPTSASKSHQGSRVTPRNPLVGRQGLEPWTYGLKARSSTD